ncbi:hypothetical protein Pan216_12550 [Planctomycetes bacterium Pan216]|uniref:DUF1552 domain-containing protein n=1 Tax=Kolteria novifilia TaxID=2527975 RepID=A0A518B0B0_9BACT|nr:hypothetical protein Pan216_12550 [Planctomycetes bacterium Pan216]
MPRSTLDRRSFLRASGVALGLPILEATARQTTRAATNQAQPRRMVAICAPLGIHTPYLVPTTAGRDYDATPYLEPLQQVRDQVSVISGLMHPMVDGGHAAEKSFLTGAAHPGQPSFRNTISLDQFAAERIGHKTRFPFLSLSAGNGGISYTRSGVLIPSEGRPSRVFKQLFLEGTPSEKTEQLRRIKSGQSILDLVGTQVGDIKRRSSRRDRQTLDQYFTSVRELEQRMTRAEEWVHRPKPTVNEKPPTDIDDRANFSGRMKLFLDLMALALQTDSTRLITLKGPGGNEVVDLKGVDDGWHNLSHHGKSPEKIEQLAIIEKEEMRLFGEFLKRLADIQEGEHSVLDQTAILLGSSLGNASSHNNSNLPIVVAGGRFDHGQHLAFAADSAPPLANLFISFLQHLELENDTFSSGKGTLRGLSS